MIATPFTSCCVIHAIRNNGWSCDAYCDCLSIHKTKHFGKLETRVLAQLYNLFHFRQTASQTEKTTIKVPLFKPNPYDEQDSIYHSISFNCPVVKNSKRILLPELICLPKAPTHHGFCFNSFTTTVILPTKSLIASTSLCTLTVSMDLFKVQHQAHHH